MVTTALHYYAREVASDIGSVYVCDQTVHGNQAMSPRLSETVCVSGRDSISPVLGGALPVGSARDGILTAPPKALAQFKLKSAIKWLSLVTTELNVIGLNFDLPAALASVKVRQFGGQRRGIYSIVGTGSYRAGFP